MKKYFTKYEIRWALAFSIFTILWAILEVEMGWHTTHLEDHKYLTFLFIIPAGLIYYLFFIDKRSRRYKRRFKFKHAFWSGLVLSVLNTILSFPCQYFIHTWVTPYFINDVKNNFVKEEILSPQKASMIFCLENILFLYAIYYFLIGVFFSILFGLILKRNYKSKKTRKAHW